jgi:hypothetical protein
MVPSSESLLQSLKTGFNSENISWEPTLCEAQEIQDEEDIVPATRETEVSPTKGSKTLSQKQNANQRAGCVA